MTTNKTCLTWWAVCFSAIFAAATVAGLLYWHKSSQPLAWQNTKQMKATLDALRIHPDKSYVYQQVQLIAQHLSSMQSDVRQSTEYDPDFMYTLSTWKITFETLALNEGELPRKCTTWYTALQLTWGEQPAQWDDETLALWDFVTSFCQGEYLDTQ